MLLGFCFVARLNWQVVECAPRVSEPFDHIFIDQALEPGGEAEIERDYPGIRSSGSFSLADARPGGAVMELVEDLKSERLRCCCERTFGVELAGLPAMVTLRGQCAARDGKVHTDSRSKVLSLLLYLNAGWTSAEGQLRLLRGPDDLDSPVVEVPAHMGALVAFLRTDNSWHGHTRYVGQRRVMQLNYLRSERASLFSSLRHRASALTKRREAA